jgi:hypothetical protein
MITLKLNFRQLKHSMMKTPKGNEVLVIPIKDNFLYQGEKGIYLDIVGFEFEDKTDKQYKDTHILKQSFKKEYLESLSEDEKRAIPIIGTARISGSQPHGEPEPKDMGGGKIADGLNDLPF